MSIVDVLIIIAVGAGIVRGFTTGLLREVLGLAGFIIALVLGIELMAFVGDKVGSIVGVRGTAARVIGFVVVFSVVQAVILLVTRLSEAATGALKLTVINRIGGGVAGAVKTVLFVSIILVLLARMNFPSDDGKRESVLYGPMVLLVPTMWDLAAEAWPRVQTMSAQFGDEVRSYWTEAANDTSTSELAE